MRDDPALVAARAARGVASAELLAAGRPPDPVLSGGFAALLGGPGAMPAISAGLTEDLSALVTYRADRAAAKAGVRQVDAGILWQEWQVAAQAEQLCVSLRADDAVLASLNGDDAALRAESAAVAAAVAAGNLTLADQSAVAAALAGVEDAQNSAAATRAQDLDQLDGLLDLAPGTALSIAPGAPPAISPAEARLALGSLPTRRPDLIALRYGYEQADAKLRSAILAQFLPVSLGAAGGRDTSDVVSAGPQFSLTLPLFSHNRPAIAAAEATRAVLRAQYQASLDDAAAGVMSLNATLARLGPEAARADAAAASAG
ncbi:TolC family protein, partial [Acidocella sp.]|uniref:TolC family protein n=1 Tax=Acidocella sp. TaxID=50710 RepID=UPI0026246F26